MRVYLADLDGDILATFRPAVIQPCGVYQLQKSTLGLKMRTRNLSALCCECFGFKGQFRGGVGENLFRRPATSPQLRMYMRI